MVAVFIENEAAPAGTGRNSAHTLKWRQKRWHFYTKFKETRGRTSLTWKRARNRYKCFIENLKGREHECFVGTNHIVCWMQ